MNFLEIFIILLFTLVSGPLNVDSFGWIWRLRFEYFRKVSAVLLAKVQAFKNASFCSWCLLMSWAINVALSWSEAACLQINNRFIRVSHCWHYVHIISFYPCIKMLILTKDAPMINISGHIQKTHWVITKFQRKEFRNRIGCHSKLNLNLGKDLKFFLLQRICTESFGIFLNGTKNFSIWHYVEVIEFLYFLRENKMSLVSNE